MDMNMKTWHLTTSGIWAYARAYAPWFLQICLRQLTRVEVLLTRKVDMTQLLLNMYTEVLDAAQITTNVINPPDPPFQTHSSSTEENHLRLKKTHSSTEEHHLGLQITTNVINPLHPPTPPPFQTHSSSSSFEENTFIHRRASSLFDENEQIARVAKHDYSTTGSTGSIGQHAFSAPSSFSPPLPTAHLCRRASGSALGSNPAGF